MEVVLMEQPLEEKSVEEGGKTFTSLRTFLMEDFLRVSVYILNLFSHFTTLI
jgi:hypothetical protein